VQPIGLSSTPHQYHVARRQWGSLRCFVSGVTGADVDEGTRLRFKTKSLSPRGKRTRLLASIQEIAHHRCDRIYCRHYWRKTSRHRGSGCGLHIYRSFGTDCFVLLSNRYPSTPKCEASSTPNTAVYRGVLICVSTDPHLIIYCKR
jgi:hypothetical protein